MEFEREIERLKEHLRALDCPARPNLVNVDITAFGREIESIVVKLMLSSNGACSFQSCDDAVFDAFYASGFTKSQFYFDGTDIDVASDGQGLRERGLHFYRTGVIGERLSKRLIDGEAPESWRIPITPRAVNPTAARAWRIAARFSALLRDRAHRLARGESR